MKPYSLWQISLHMLCLMGMCFIVPAYAQTVQTKIFNDVPIQVKPLEASPSTSDEPVQQPQPSEQDSYNELYKELDKDGFETPTTPREALPKQRPDAIVPPPKPEQTGFFTYERTATVRAPRTGKILPIDLEIGQVLRQDETVITIDCIALSAEIEEVRIRHNIAKIKRQRAMLEREQDKITRDELSLIELEVEIALAKLNRLRKEKETCTVAVPFASIVHKIHAQEGQSVLLSAPLLDVVSAAPLHFIVELPVAWIKDVQVGKEFRVYVEGLDQSSHVKIIRIDDQVNLASQTISVIAKTLEKLPLLRSGMRGIVRFEDKKGP
ncbi:MAG: efflux RND transporter periplasmic adaptor subunit [Candidatus Oxydemutatoraceae bacterium WSBS_2016_MAG_OTU14]